MKKILFALLLLSNLSFAQDLAPPLFSIQPDTRNYRILKSFQINDTLLFKGHILWAPNITAAGSFLDSGWVKDHITGEFKLRPPGTVSLTGIPYTVPFFDGSGNITSSYDFYFAPPDGDLSLSLAGAYGSTSIAGGAHSGSNDFTIATQKIDSAISSYFISHMDDDVVQI